MPILTCPGCGAKINTETGEATAGAGAPPTPEPLGETDAERADRLAREVEDLRGQLTNAGRQHGANLAPPNARRRGLFNRGDA